MAIGIEFSDGRVGARVETCRRQVANAPSRRHGGDVALPIPDKAVCFRRLRHSFVYAVFDFGEGSQCDCLFRLWQSHRGESDCSFMT